MIKYFDDHLVGEQATGTPCRIERTEVLEFAQAFARPIEDGGDTIKTSAAHIVAIYQKLQIDLAFESGAAPAIMAGLGMDELRFLQPVYSGDELHLAREVIACTASRSKGDPGWSGSATPSRTNAVKQSCRWLQRFS